MPQAYALRPSWPVSLLSAAVLAACSTTPLPPDGGQAQRVAHAPASGLPNPAEGFRRYVNLGQRDKAQELVMFTFGLLDIGYKFGGRNPEAGLDCSGMVSYVVEQVAGLRLPHNAARIASITRPVDRELLRPGDLVFFNTDKRPYSHMGIYIGDNRFVHAPRTNSTVRVARLDSPYFLARYDGARTLFIDRTGAPPSLTVGSAHA